MDLYASQSATHNGQCPCPSIVVTSFEESYSPGQVGGAASNDTHVAQSPRAPKPLPESWPSILPGRSSLAASPILDIQGVQSSHFPGQPLTKDSGGVLCNRQWRHIRATYAYARYLFDEEEELPKGFSIPLGYIIQLLWHINISIEGLPAPSPADMEAARISAGVFPNFPGMPLEDNFSRSLSPVQLMHVEDVYCKLVAEDGPEVPGYRKGDYNYLLALLGQLILHHRGTQGLGASHVGLPDTL